MGKLESDLLNQIFGGGNGSGMPGGMGGDLMSPFKKQDPQQLKALVAEYQVQNTFKVGDVVQWKTGLKNKKFPAYNTPVIVVEVFDQPLRADPGNASQLAGEPLSARLGMVDNNDGEFTTFCFDLQRFELYQG